MASHKRPIQDGSQYDKLIDLAEVDGMYELKKKNYDTTDTVKLMADIVNKHYKQVARLADHLKKPTLKQSLRNLWDFAYTHIQFTEDPKTKESVRRPATTWADRKEGVDCDCYGVFVGSILKNWKVPFAFRRADYGNGGYQHVYVVAPMNGKKGQLDNGAYYTIDPVLNAFDLEKKPIVRKSDTYLSGSGLYELSGFGKAPGMLNGGGCCCDGKSGKQMPVFKRHRYLTRDEIKIRGLLLVSEWLEKEGIPYEKTMDENTGTEGNMVALPTGEPVTLPNVSDLEDLSDFKIVFNSLLQRAETGIESVVEPVSDRRLAKWALIAGGVAIAVAIIT